MGFVQVLWAAISTVLSTAGVIGMGAVLIRRGWVGPAAVKEWSKTVTGFMLPCFLFSNMSSTTLDQLQEGWVLPVFCVVHIMIGMLLGTVTSMLLRADWGSLGSPTTAARSFSGGIVAMSGFGNASLGLSMMPAIIAGNPALGTKEHAAFCVTLYAVLNKVGIWRFVRRGVPAPTHIHRHRLHPHPPATGRVPHPHPSPPPPPSSVATARALLQALRRSCCLHASSTKRSD